MTDLASRFAALDLARLEGFVGAQQEENLHLEFKTASGADMRSQDDRRNFARALSGFANADGGLLVWGIVARKSEGSFDCATELSPIASIGRFVARLNELTSDAVTPSPDGVQHRIVDEASDGSGFAVTLVEPSDAGPHMAKLGVDQYFKRAGDSFIKMEHFDIADMFGRRPRPALEVVLSAHGAGKSTKNGVESVLFRVVGAIENSGRGSALAPYLSVDVQRPYVLDRYGVDGNGGFGLPRLPTRGSAAVFGASANIVVHPGTRTEVFAVGGEYEVERPHIADLVVHYELAASDLPLTTGTLTMTAEDLVRSMRER